MRMAAAISACALASLAGCAVVRIEDPRTGNVEVQQRFGLVSIEVAPKVGGTVVESTGVGVMKTFEGIAVGYHSGTVAAFAQGECRMVLWIKTGEQLDELQRMLRDRSDICVVEPGDPSRRKP